MRLGHRPLLAMRWHLYTHGVHAGAGGAGGGQRPQNSIALAESESVLPLAPTHWRSTGCVAVALRYRPPDLDHCLILLYTICTAQADDALCGRRHPAAGGAQVLVLGPGGPCCANSGVQCCRADVYTPDASGGSTGSGGRWSECAPLIIPRTSFAAAAVVDKHGRELVVVAVRRLRLLAKCTGDY